MTERAKVAGKVIDIETLTPLTIEGETHHPTGEKHDGLWIYAKAGSPPQAPQADPAQADAQSSNQSRKPSEKPHRKKPTIRRKPRKGPNKQVSR